MIFQKQENEAIRKVPEITVRRLTSETDAV